VQILALSEKEHGLHLTVNKTAEGIDDVQEGNDSGNESSGDADDPLEPPSRDRAPHVS